MSGLSASQFKALHAKLSTDGGFSANAATGAAPTVGYMVSLPGSEQQIRTTKTSPAHLEQYVKDNASALSKPDRFFGGWRDGGHDWLDSSVNVTPGPMPTKGSNRDRSKVRRDNKREAMDVAKQGDQKAIYDVAAGKSIRNPKYSGDRG